MSELTDQYDAAVEAYRNDPSDENKAAKDDLANKVVEARQTARLHRDVDLGLNDGQAQPEAVQGSTEVNQ